MNLQLTSPYKQCPFKCPYCVSAFEGEYPFEELYLLDPHSYFVELGKVLFTGNFTGVVLTGMTDPSLFPEWISDVMNFITAFFPEVETTIQTRDYSYENKEKVKVVAFSIGHRNLIKQTPMYPSDVVLRFNMMLSQNFTFQDMLDLAKKYKDREGTQFTVKYLMATSQNHEKVDEWIKSNRLELTEEEETIAKEKGFWVDKSCMDNETRYRIFRTDGHLYRDWYTNVPEDVPVLMV